MNKRGYYVPSDFANWTEKEMRAEYTRLRDIYHKRMQRLEKWDILPKQKLDVLKTKMPKIRDMQNAKEQLPFALSEISKAMAIEPTTQATAKKWREDSKKRFDDAMQRMYDAIWGEYHNPVEHFKQFIGTIDEWAFWEFVEYTKNVVNDNLFYWNQKRTRLLMDTKSIVDKVNSGLFSEAYDEVLYYEADTLHTFEDEKAIRDARRRFKKLVKDVRKTMKDTVDPTKNTKQLKRDVKRMKRDVNNLGKGYSNGNRSKMWENYKANNWTQESDDNKRD